MNGNRRLRLPGQIVAAGLALAMLASQAIAQTCAMPGHMNELQEHGERVWMLGSLAWPI